MDNNKISNGALGGFVDALGGDSRAERISITDHEILDMAVSGQAYSLDGRYNFLHNSPLLRRMWEAYEATQNKAN